MGAVLGQHAIHLEDACAGQNQIGVEGGRGQVFVDGDDEGDLLQGLAHHVGIGPLGHGAAGHGPEHVHLAGIFVQNGLAELEARNCGHLLEQIGNVDRRTGFHLAHAAGIRIALALMADLPAERR